MNVATALDEISSLRHTVVLYEAPNRLADTLAELEQRGNGNRPAAVAREMTKQFEEVRRGTVGELRAYYKDSLRVEKSSCDRGARRACASDDDGARTRAALRARE